MLSERTYWIILIIAFSVIASLIWFWLIPYQIIEYNLGINLFTSSIFMVLTIIFLGWLLTLRERREWKFAKDRTLNQIKHLLKDAFFLLQNLCEIPDSPDSKRSLLSELANQKRIPLRKDITSYLSKEDYNIDGYIEAFDEIADELKDIERYYSTFLEPKLLCNLLIIKDCSLDIVYHLRVLKRIEWGSHKDAEKRYFEEIFAPIIQEAIKALYNMEMLGIKVSQLHSIVRVHVRPTKGFV